MTTRLAIDAATDRLFVAVDRDRGAPVELTLDGARRHAGALLGLIERALAAAGSDLRSVEVVAIADGPGSFTGLRVSFATAKALARRGAVLMTAPSLLLRAAETPWPTEQRVMALAPALRGEVYAAAWRRAPSGLEPLLAARPIGPGDLAKLPEVDRIVGEGPAELLARLPRPVEPAQPAATALLRLLEWPGAARAVSDPAAFEPDYGRPAEAQAKWEREHGRPFPDPSRVRR